MTGTNGKTTTTFLVDSILQAAGYTTGLLGTTGYRTPKGSRGGANTTPESLDLQQMFAEVRDAGGTHAVLETSSHALAMDRLWGCHFAVAIFTNLTRDHLDYHKTFEGYFAAKRRLFEGTGAGAPDVAVINADDPYASRLEGLTKRTLTYGLKGTPEITTRKFTPSFEGLEFTAHTPAGKIEVRSTLVGRINVYNILAAHWRRHWACKCRTMISNKELPIWNLCPDVFSGSTKGSRFWWWWTTRIPMMPCEI